MCGVATTQHSSRCNTRSRGDACHVVWLEFRTCIVNNSEIRWKHSANFSTSSADRWLGSVLRRSVQYSDLCIRKSYSDGDRQRRGFSECNFRCHSVSHGNARAPYSFAVSGNGFAVNSTVTITCLGASSAYDPDCNRTVTGSFSDVWFTGVSGVYWVTATDANSNSASVTFTIR